MSIGCCYSSIEGLHQHCSILRRSYPKYTRCLTTIGAQIQDHLRSFRSSTWSILGSIPKQMGSKSISCCCSSIGGHRRRYSIQRRSFPMSTRYLTTIGVQIQDHLRSFQSSTWSILGSIPRQMGSMSIGCHCSSIRELQKHCNIQ
jgi:hypothetical protein